MFAGFILWSVLDALDFTVFAAFCWDLLIIGGFTVFRWTELDLLLFA